MIFRKDSGDTEDWYFPAESRDFRNFCLAKLTKIPTLNGASSATVLSRDTTNDQKVSEISNGARLRGERACRWQTRKAERPCFPFCLPAGLENPFPNFQDENRKKTRCFLRPGARRRGASPLPFPPNVVSSGKDDSCRVSSFRMQIKLK